MSAEINFTPQDSPWLKLRQAANIFQTQQQNSELIDHAKAVAMSAVRTILAGGQPIPASLTPADLQTCNRLISELIKIEVTR